MVELEEHIFLLVGREYLCSFFINIKKYNAIKYDTVSFNNNFRRFVLYVFVFLLHVYSLLFFLLYPVNWKIPRILVFLPVPLILFLLLEVFCLLGSYLTPPLCLEVFVSRHFLFYIYKILLHGYCTGLI